MNYETYKEFSWHIRCPDSIESDRIRQYLPNCWAISMASCIGDNFCIQENIKAIYPSSIWITTLIHEFEKFKFLPFNPMSHGLFMTREILEYFLNNYYVSLESCESIITADAIITNEYLNKNPYGDGKDYNFINIAEKTVLGKEKFFNCCSECFGFDELRKTTCVYDYPKCNKDQYKFKILLDNSYAYYYGEEYSYYFINKTKIKGVQKIMKSMLCSGPIVANFSSTKNYEIYARKIREDKKLIKDTPIFYETDTTAGKINNHNVEILGWGVEPGRGQPDHEFWYIKDSHYPSLFLKIPFTTMSNLNLSIGPDFIDNDTTSYRSYRSTFYSIKTKPLDIELKKTLITDGVIKLSDRITIEELKLLS